MAIEKLVRPQPEAVINKSVRKYIERGAQRWNLQKTVQELYRWSDVNRFYFFSPKEAYQNPIPNLVIGVEPMDIRTLAHYHVKENAVGLPYEISFNQSYIDLSLWELNEILVHEMIHLYQENTPGLQPCKGGWHNLQFVDIAEEIGLHPLPGIGAHWCPANGQFARLMERCGLPKPKRADRDFAKPDGQGKPPNWWDDQGKKKGKSTLILYTNPSCTRKPTPCKIRSGRSDLRLKCEECGGTFKPQL
jgi:hypothetical protein